MNPSAVRVITLHWAGAVTVRAVVFPAKAHTAVFEREQPAVGDRHTVGVAGEIGQDLLGAGEWGLGIDHPLGAAQRGQVADERRGRVQRVEIAKEAELAGVEGGLQTVEEQAAEQLFENRYG